VATRERFRGGGPHEASEADTRRTIRVTVNGQDYERDVDVRRTLGDFIREDLRLTGLHYGCEHGVCGACTVLLDGNAVRSCLLLAVQVHGRNLKTIEGVASPEGELSPIQQAFWDNHGLQCGFCTPGMVLATEDFLRNNPNPTRDEVREGMSGNICRCTGYQLIVDSILDAAEALRNGETGGTDAGAS
jgi:aerobic carbon-monoxide dehydrogenase small subunit